MFDLAAKASGRKSAQARAIRSNNTQLHPDDANASIASVYLVLAVRDDVLNKQRDFAKAPIPRNLVPAQLLMGKSSFNAGNSISAGLPK